MIAGLVLVGFIVALAESPNMVAAEDQGKDKDKGKHNGDDKNKGKNGCEDGYEHNAKHKEPPGGCKDHVGNADV